MRNSLLFARFSNTRAVQEKALDIETASRLPLPIVANAKYQEHRLKTKKKKKQSTDAERYGHNEEIKHNSSKSTSRDVQPATAPKDQAI